MFEALLAHPQEALHRLHLIYCVRVMSVGCTPVRAVISVTLICTSLKKQSNFERVKHKQQSWAG
jgi:hypothetical protein